MSLAQSTATPPQSESYPRSNSYRRIDRNSLETALHIRREELADVESYLDDLRAGRTRDIEDVPGPWQHPENSRDFLAWQIEQAEQELQRREWIATHPLAPKRIERRADLNAIKQRIDLAAFIEQVAGVSFRQVRNRRWTSCPLPGHGDSEPSFSVSNDKGVWFCFGCQRGGDIFSFVQILRDLPFGDAIDIVRREGGIDRADHRSPADVTVFPSSVTFTPLRTGGRRAG